jgi:gluconokinase
MVVILFGVAGSGKTTVGRLLSRELGWRFYDADDLHPISNIENMKQGIPLSGEDRKPWLERVRELIRACLAQRINAVLACSALKESYRQFLRIDEEVIFVFLKGEFGLIQERLRRRRGHFIDPSLLRSQFDTLEEPKEGAVVVDVTSSPSAVVETIKKCLGI